MVGGKQRILLEYQTLAPSAATYLNEMTLIMKLLPEDAWETLGKPPPSSVDYISAVPHPQDIQFSLNYGSSKVRFSCPRSISNRL